MGCNSCCKTKVVCNRPPADVCSCYKEKPKCCEKPKCEKPKCEKPKCEKKCLEASDVICLLERYSRRQCPPFPPFPPVPPTPPTPPFNPVATPISTDTTVVLDGVSNIYYFALCLPVVPVTRNFAVFRFGTTGRFYTALVTPSDTPLPGCGPIGSGTWNVIFTEAIGDQLVGAGLLVPTATPGEFKPSVAGVAYIINSTEMASILSRFDLY